jgi:YegS/Rv2252/BmrU family lipid kinase
VVGRERAAIIYNPTSGRPGRRARRVAELTTLLKRHGIHAIPLATNAPEDATRLAREAIDHGAGIIVSYGGDGTANEVIQAMVGREAVLAVWPGGTANLLATELRMPRHVRAVADAVAVGKTRRISLGRATLRREARDRYFSMCAGIGLDASICRAANLRLKRWTGAFAYWMSGLEHMMTYRPESFTIEVEGVTYETMFAVIANGPRYGGRFSLTPRAALDGVTFEVFVARRHGHNLAYVPDLVRCLCGGAAQASQAIISARRVEAHSLRQPWVELDGEVFGPLPAAFEPVPEALSVIVPP